MSLNERDEKRPTLADQKSTVVVGTPNLAVALSRSRTTVPLGFRRVAAAAAKVVGIDTQAPTLVGTPSTERGQPPSVAELSNLGATVAGVGPEVLRSLLAGARSAASAATTPSRMVEVNAAPESPRAAASAAASQGARSAAVSTPDGTQISVQARQSAPRREPPSQAPPSQAPRHSAPQPSEGSEEESRRPGLFRSAAVEARRGETEQAQVDFLAGFKPKGWSVLLLLSSLVGVLFLGAALAKVEVTAEAQGMLRAPKGLRPVASAQGGSLSELLVQSGDHVEAGQVVARLEATELRANLVTRERELELTRHDVSEAARRDRNIEERTLLAMQRQKAALVSRIGINNEKLAQRRKQAENYAELERLGGASATESLTMKESLQSAAEGVAALNSDLARLELDMADRARSWEERATARQLQLSRAEANVEEAKTVLAATEVKAPAAGQIESVLAAPGNVLEAGGLLGNIVPSGVPRTIVAFVPSRDIAFVAPGATATVEVQSLSVSEFGLGKATVKRVSSDVATPTEVQGTLGEVLQGAVVRVELELTDSESSARMDPHLRSGDRVTIRLHRRERRVITLLFDFVRRWVQ